MTSSKPDLTVDDLCARIERVMGKRLLKLTRPGGSDRPIYRAYFRDGSVIVSHREDGEEAERERAVLARLGTLSSSVPRLLAIEDGLTYQSDGGQDRLNIRLHLAEPDEQLALIDKALGGIVDYQRAARGCKLPDLVAPIGTDRAWIRHFARGPQRQAGLLGLPEPALDVGALQSALEVEAPSFVKWDCRAANAALNGQDRLCWFDFEHCGLRHGVEDFAWLICDEAFPQLLSRIYPRIERLIRQSWGTEGEAALRMFDIFGALQASFRLRVVLQEIHKKSWTARQDILKTDLVGADPFMAERLAENGAFLAQRHVETRPFVELMRSTARAFRDAQQSDQPVRAVALSQ